MAENFEKKLYKLTASYNPSEAVKNEMQSRRIITVTAPPGSGKHAVMAASGVPVIRAHTNTPLNEASSVLYHPIRTVAQQEATIDHLEKGNYVYAATHPLSGFFLGALIEDFPSKDERQLACAFPGQNKILRESSIFGELLGVYIVPCDETKRLQAVPKHSPEQKLDYLSWLLETRMSLSEALGDNGMHFIANDKTDSAAANLRDFADYGHLTRRFDIEEHARYSATVIMGASTYLLHAAAQHIAP